MRKNKKKLRQRKIGNILPNHEMKLFHKMNDLQKFTSTFTALFYEINIISQILEYELQYRLLYVNES